MTNELKEEYRVQDFHEVQDTSILNKSHDQFN